MHTLEFDGRQKRRSLHIHRDFLECCDVRIATEAVTGVRVIKNPVPATAHYDLEVETAGSLFTFPNTGLAPGSECLAQLNQTLPWGPIGQISPIAQASTLGNEHLQLFEDRIRIKDFDYRHWPDETTSIPLSSVREIRYLARSRMLTDVLIQARDTDIVVVSCANTGMRFFQAGLKRIAPSMVQKHLQPWAVMSFRGTTGGEAVSAYVDGLMALTQFIPYEDLVGLTYEKLDEIRWSMTIHGRGGSVRCSPIGLIQALPLKHRIEAICSDLPVEIIGARSLEEDVQRQKTQAFSSVLVFVCLFLLAGLAYVVIDSGLIAQIVGRVRAGWAAMRSTPSSPFSSLEQIAWMALPLLGILLFSVPYAQARNVKEKKLDSHRLPGGITAKEVAVCLGRLQRATPRIVSTDDETVMRYDPSTRILFLPTSILQSCCVSSAVQVAHELGHYVQSFKIGNFPLMTIKSLEALIRKSSLRLSLMFGFSMLIAIVFGLRELVLVVLGVFLPIYLVELVVMAGSLIIELDADRRARSMLKQAGLLHRDDFRAVTYYLLCLSLIRILMYIAFFLPTFGLQYRRFEKDQVILV